MKKQIALATTAAALLSSGAYASKARMLALGQDTAMGSYFVDDTRNKFRNAANIASMNNYMITEWGSAQSGSDADTGTAAEGGIFRNAGSFSYGLYFGNDNGSQNNVRTANQNGYAQQADSNLTAVTTGSTALIDRTNELDLFIGGDMGVEWGARISYASSKNKVTTASTKEAKQSSLGIGLGMNMGDLGAWLNLGLSDKTENTATTSEGIKWEADTAINVGLNYDWMDWTFFAEYDTKGAEFTSGTGVAKNETSRDTITVGAGHKHQISSTSMVGTEIKYISQTSEDKDGTTTTNGGEVKSSTLPVAFVFETDANSWLTLRGAVAQNILFNSVKTTSNVTGSQEGEDSNNDTINVNAGATLNFGKLKVDGMIGTGGNTGTGTTSTAETGSLSLDRLMTRVGVSYWF